MPKDQASSPESFIIQVIDALEDRIASDVVREHDQKK